MLERVRRARWVTSLGAALVWVSAAAYIVSKLSDGADLSNWVVAPVEVLWVGFVGLAVWGWVLQLMRLGR